MRALSDESITTTALCDTSKTWTPARDGDAPERVVLIGAVAVTEPLAGFEFKLVEDLGFGGGDKDDF